MVIYMSTAFASRASYRRENDDVMSEIKNPEFDQIKELLERIDFGDVECLNLHGPSDEKFCIIARAGFYHLTIFVEENKGYAFNDGSEERSQKIEIAGNYWPSFRVCKNKVEAFEALQAFFYLGTFPEAQCWIPFSDD